MRADLFLAAAAFPMYAAAAYPFCVENAMAAHTAHASLVAPSAQPRLRLYDEMVAPGRQSCCNPRNFTCNPLRIADAGTLLFRAGVDAPAASALAVRRLTCGLVSEPRAPRLVSVPVRGVLRFEANPAFRAKEPIGPRNSPFLARTFVRDPRSSVERPLEDFPCVD